MEKEQLERLRDLVRWVYVYAQQSKEPVDPLAEPKDVTLPADVEELVDEYVKEEQRLLLVTALGPMRKETLTFSATAGLLPGPWKYQQGFHHHPRTGKPCLEVVNSKGAVVWRFAEEGTAALVTKALNSGAPSVDVEI